MSEALLRKRSGTFDLETVFSVSLSQMQLTRIDSALNQCTSLTALDLSFNSLSGVGGLDANAMCKLKKLDLSCNKLTNIDLLPSLPSLSSLYLQGNNLMLLDDVLQVVSNRFPSLSVLCLRNIDGSKANPLCATENYRAIILKRLPTLTVLDGERVKSEGAVIYQLSEDVQNGKYNMNPNEKDKKSTDKLMVNDWLEGMGMEIEKAGELNFKDVQQDLQKSLSDCKSLSIDALEQITITKRHSASRLDLIKSHIHNLQHGDRINVFLESILKGLPVSANNVKNNSNFAPSNSTVSQLLSSMSSSSSSSSSSSRLSK